MSRSIAVAFGPDRPAGPLDVLPLSLLWGVPLDRTGFPSIATP
jgi:hypothetical protein